MDKVTRSAVATVRRAYIAGPMTGYADWNRPAFAAAGRWACERGWEPVSPQDTIVSHDGPCPPGPLQMATHGGVTGAHPHACWLRASLLVMLKCDAVLLLPGWGSSAGATLERRVAVACGMPVEAVPAEVFVGVDGQQAVEDGPDDEDLLAEVSEYAAKRGIPRVCVIPECGCIGLEHP